MVPSNAVQQALGDLLAADAALLAPATDANKIHLVKSPFVPAGNTQVADLTLADFDGSTPIAVGTGTQPSGLDPNTGANVIDLKMPAGGFRWETTGTANLPQTIYGYILTDLAGTTYLGGALLDAPETLTAINQRIDIGQPSFTVPAGSMF